MEIKMEIKKKLKQFPKPNKVTLDHKYELMIWLNALKQGSLVRLGYFYPLGSFKDNIIAMDLKSFVKMMNCSFSKVFKEACSYTKGNIEVDITNIRTDGYSLQFIKKYTTEQPKYAYQKEFYDEEKDETTV
eukprot:NODE_485_length_7794_cov_0.605848.p5 type:complete len:131 gc:universal NODE_485_length_7794_cov_0.605848:7152-7544(+)